jgi:hypothetical protein
MDRARDSEPLKVPITEQVLQGEVVEAIQQINEPQKIAKNIADNNMYRNLQHSLFCEYHMQWLAKGTRERRTLSAAHTSPNA